MQYTYGYMQIILFVLGLVHFVFFNRHELPGWFVLCH